MSRENLFKDAKKLQPEIYHNVLEFNAIALAYNHVADNAFKDILKLWGNQFIQTAFEDGIAKFEALAGIVPRGEDTLEERRKRLLAYSFSNARLTTPFLKMKLDEVLGVGKYDLRIDYAKQLMVISFEPGNQRQALEIANFVSDVKPAALQFRTSSKFFSNAFITETIATRTQNLNYRLGLTFKFSPLKPFISLGQEVLLKMPPIKSLGDNLWTIIIKDYLTKQTWHIKVNDTTQLSIPTVEFIDDTASNGKLRLLYSVPQNTATPAITKLEVLCNSKTVAIFNTYVDNSFEVTLEHIWNFQEGE